MTGTGMLLVKLFFFVFAVGFSLYFFKRSAGSISPCKLNPVSVTMYLFLVQELLGLGLITLGFTEHYTFTRLVDKEATLNQLFPVLLGTAVLWPASIYLFLRLLRVRSAEKEYAAYLQAPTAMRSNETYAFWAIAAVGALSLALLGLYLGKIGYIPLLQLVFPPEGFDFATARIEINQTVIFNVYVRNLLVLTAIPVLSYITFAYALVNKKLKWILLAVLFFGASIITKTYNFEKSPVVFHLFIYLIIFGYVRGGIRMKWLLAAVGAGVVLLFAAYGLTGKTATIALYSGPFSRIVFTPVGALAFNFDLFPNVFPYLMGRSASATLLGLFGIPAEMHLRSARLLMEYYGSESVYAQTAGVSNSLFIGEAYANFGWIGLLLGILWVGFIIALLFMMILKLRKTPATVALAAYLTVNIATTTQGGFFDFLYNPTWIFVIAAVLLYEYLPALYARFCRSVKKPRSTP